MIEWHTVLTGEGTVFTAGEYAAGNTLMRRIVVKRIEWQKPGFKNVRSTGWAVFLDGKQYGIGAMPTAKAMREHIGQPGVWKDIEAKLAKPIEERA